MSQKFMHMLSGLHVFPPVPPELLPLAPEEAAWRWTKRCVSPNERWLMRCPAGWERWNKRCFSCSNYWPTYDQYTMTMVGLTIPGTCCGSNSGGVPFYVIVTHVSGELNRTWTLTKSTLPNYPCTWYGPEFAWFHARSFGPSGCTGQAGDWDFSLKWRMRSRQGYPNAWIVDTELMPNQSGCGTPFVGSAYEDPNSTGPPQTFPNAYPFCTGYQSDGNVHFGSGGVATVLPVIPP